MTVKDETAYRFTLTWKCHLHNLQYCLTHLSFKALFRCASVQRRREQKEDSEQHEFCNGFLLHSGLFGLIIHFFSSCPDPLILLFTTSPIVTTAERSPAILYYCCNLQIFIFFHHKSLASLAPL